ncbi:MAG: S41 family peptidase [Acidobacteriota bacterium]
MNKKFILLVFTLLLFSTTASAQNLKAERILHQNILKDIKKDIQEKYYDPKLRGVDIEENYKKTSDLIKNVASSDEMSDLIARFCLLFDDSHLYFLPPRKTVKVDYGWKLLLIDGKAFVTEIKDDSDAYKKGVRAGDQIYMIEGYIPNRQEFSMLRYHFQILRPQTSLNLLLIKPSGNKYKLDVQAKIIRDNDFIPSTRDLMLEYQKNYSENSRQIVYDKIPGLSILKMTSFNLTTIKVDKMMDKVEKSDALILDLRGNGGGYLISLEQLVNNFFDKEVKVGKVIERDGIKSYSIQPHIKKPYTGKLVVLIDSDSASAAEIFARIVQLEKRGTVIGDQSAGAVMQAILMTHTFGLDSLIPYGVSVTVADLIMKDGQRLEKVGVTPDEKIVPTALDLANNRDPVLSRAAKILGYQMTAEEAGQILGKDK